MKLYQNLEHIAPWCRVRPQQGGKVYFQSKHFGKKKPARSKVPYPWCYRKQLIGLHEMNK